MRKNLQKLVYRQHINKVVAYIQHHLGEPIRLETLADIAGFSRFHFHRIFTAFIGETLGEYTRRLRLEKGCLELLYTQRPVTEIALSIGYETPAAFAKAFRQRFSTSPTNFRKRGERPLIEKIERYKQPQEIRSKQMKPKIRDLPERRVIYVRKKGVVDNIFTQAADAAFDVICSYLTKNNLWSQVGVCLGIYPDDPSLTPPEECRYDGGFVLKEGVDIQPEEEVQIQTIPGGKYAIFLHEGTYETLWQTWNAIYRDWLPASGLKLRDVIPYEVYLKDKQKTKPEDLLTEIHLAIE